MLQAKEIMTKEVVVVRPDTPIKEAVELLLANQIAGVPVVEEDMTLVGIVTEKDLLELFCGSKGTETKTVEEFIKKCYLAFTSRLKKFVPGVVKSRVNHS